MAAVATPDVMTIVESPLSATPMSIGRSPKPNTPSAKGASSPRSAMKEKKLRDNAVTMQLTKTKMCAFFERGKCASANCRYAHSVAELRAPPNLKGTKLCMAFLSGGGCNDENCPFAHGETNLRVTEGIYKTQICNFFERGYCKKGDRCNHAHGAVDLRPAAPSAASTPMGKMTPSSQGESTRSRRSPLPLSQLLLNDEVNVGMGVSPTYSMGVPPTPTKSVTELAHMAFSPVHSTPFSPVISTPNFYQMGQYSGAYPMSPVSVFPPVSEMAPMWPPRDAVDMLVQEPYSSPAMNLMYAMDAMEPVLDMPSHFPDNTPQKTLELLSLDQSPSHRPAPGLAQPAHSTPVCSLPGSSEPARCSPPGLDEPSQPFASEAKDPLMLNLSERLAKLDAVVQGLGEDVAAIKSDPNKRLHRI